MRRHEGLGEMRRETPAYAGRNAGFTLIEVTLALLVLGGSLVVLLGLQSSIVDRTLRDSKRQRAMLLSRQILAILETAKEPPALQKTNGSFHDVLTSLTDSSKDAAAPNPEDAEFEAHFEVQDVGLPEINPNAMRKVTLKISWGPDSIDQITAVYFTPGD